MAAAASRLELALCFEDVAKNIFGNADLTMSRPQLAAILAADTGLGLQQWELKLFLAEFELSDRVDASQFCAIYTYLASRPATPAPAEWAIDNVRVAFDTCGPGADGKVSKAELCREIAGMDLKDKGPVILATINKHASEHAGWPEIEKLTRQGIRMLRSEKFSVANGGPSAEAIGAAVNKLAAPAARAVAAAGAVFPPDFVVKPGAGGHIPTEEFVSTTPAPELGAESTWGWRPYDGAGQSLKYPFLGGSGAPYSLCVKSTHTFTKLPSAEEVVQRLHLRSGGAFLQHPNGVSGVMLAFATLVAKELGLGGDTEEGGAGDVNAMSSYLDLQLLYGVSEAECSALREGVAGKIKSDAAAGTGKVGSAAAAALLTVFSRNHNKIAEHVANRRATGAEDDEEVFQIARHVNILTLRSVFLKDYVPFLAAGAHLPEALTIPPLAKPTVKGEWGVNGCVELDLMLRGLSAMEPQEGVAPVEASNAAAGPEVALAAASAAACGWTTRCNIPARLAASEAAAVERARAVGVCTLNEFRLQMGLHAWADFSEMTQEPELTEVLAELYGTVDNCELYTGLLCEYNLGNGGAMLPHTAHMCSLPLNIIAADKWFSKRSLLESNTYTKWGLEYSAKASLAALLAEHTKVVVGGESVFKLGALKAA